MLCYCKVKSDVSHWQINISRLSIGSRIQCVSFAFVDRIMVLCCVLVMRNQTHLIVKKYTNGIWNRNVCDQFAVCSPDTEGACVYACAIGYEILPDRKGDVYYCHMY